jgi:hypothetical protein
LKKERFDRLEALKDAHGNFLTPVKLTIFRNHWQINFNDPCWLIENVSLAIAIAVMAAG